MSIFKSSAEVFFPSSLNLSTPKTFRRKPILLDKNVVFRKTDEMNYFPISKKSNPQLVTNFKLIKKK